MNAEIAEILDSFEPEQLLDHEGYEYKHTFGTNGPQLNVRECPRCGNSSWKVYINAESGLGNCFVCPDGANKFNKFTLARAILGEVSNRETVNYLKQFVLSLGYQPKRPPRPVQIHSSEVSLPTGCLPLPYQGSNLIYLERRGIDAETARYFDLHYCHRGTWTSAEGKEIDFGQRVIFPVFDLLDGTLKTFQGRDITGESKKKYLFPPGHAASGVLLYNGHNAIGADTVVITEGVFDCLSTKVALEQHQDLRGVVPIATFGKHLGINKDGNDQLSKLFYLRSKGLRTVVMMWDAEQEAIKEAFKVADVLRKHGFNARIARLPDGCDPNETLPDTLVHTYRQARSYTPALHTQAKLGRF